MKRGITLTLIAVADWLPEEHGVSPHMRRDNLLQLFSAVHLVQCDKEQ
jgi:hypothetical protein